MIKCHLSKLMGEKKLKISDVAKDTGINRGTITRLYHETAVRVEFDVLEQLCVYLGCDIADLLELSTDDAKAKELDD
ncbi:MAG: XRE family transcriptional regulator [Marinomonas sp.]|nr:MAG: XRE family transcriptional regulator [Marinomonas sp.]